MGEESERLQEQHINDMANDFCREMDEESYQAFILGMSNRYFKSESAEIGATIECAYCGKLIVKKTYNRRHCNSLCKDKYWNNVDEKRRSRAKRFNQ